MTERRKPKSSFPEFHREFGLLGYKHPHVDFSVVAGDYFGHELTASYSVFKLTTYYNRKDRRVVTYRLE